MNRFYDSLYLAGPRFPAVQTPLAPRNSQSDMLEAIQSSSAREIMTASQNQTLSLVGIGESLDYTTDGACACQSKPVSESCPDGHGPNRTVKSANYDNIQDILYPGEASKASNSSRDRSTSPTPSLDAPNTETQFKRGNRKRRRSLSVIKTKMNETAGLSRITPVMAIETMKCVKQTSTEHISGECVFS